MGRRTAVVLETVREVARRGRRFLLIRTPAWCDLRGGYQRLALAHEHRLRAVFGVHVWQPA
jgi:hypothetical protein